MPAHGSTTGLNLPFQTDFPVFLFNVLHTPTKQNTSLLTKAHSLLFSLYAHHYRHPNVVSLSLHSLVSNNNHHSRPRSNAFFNEVPSFIPSQEIKIQLCLWKKYTNSDKVIKIHRASISL